MDISGASAIVTGGASGIGAAAARQLAAKGATVVIADLQADKGEALAAEIGGVFAQGDVTNTDQIKAAVEAADRAEEIARDLEYEIVSSAPDGEQLADDYEELGGGRCAVM